MISVITPTMWKYGPYLEFLNYILEHPVIGEVIIINNNKAETPTHPALNHSKVRMITPDENIYVNPAWNLGAREAKNRNLCFLSDDVIVDMRVFPKVNDFMEKADNNLGMIYICPGYEDQQQPKVTTGEIEIETGIVTNRYGYGALFFVRKEEYVPIPEQFKIWFGDHFQFMFQQEKKKTSYYIKNCFFYTPWGVTVRFLGNSGNFQVNDDAEFQKYQGIGK